MKQTVPALILYGNVSRMSFADDQSAASSTICNANPESAASDVATARVECRCMTSRYLLAE